MHSSKGDKGSVAKLPTLGIHPAAGPRSVASLVAVGISQALTLQLALVFGPSLARAEFFTSSWDTHHENAHEFSLGGDFQYYETSSNFSSGTSTVTPSGLDYADRIDLQAFGTFGLTDRLSLYGVFDWRRSEVQAVSGSGLMAGNTYGLGDQTVGANYRIYQSGQSDSSSSPTSTLLGTTNGTSIDLQLQVDFPGYANPTSPTTPLLGDGSVDTTVGALVNVPISNGATHDFAFRGGAGVTYRTGGFSADIPWSAAVDYQAHEEGLLVSVGLYGIESLRTDNSSNVPGSGSDGSFITYAVNPSLASVRGVGGYRLRSGTDLFLAAAQSFYGENSPDGFTVSAGLTLHLGRPVEAKNPALESPMDYRKSNRGFVSYDIEAKVVRANDQFGVIKIDHGSDDGVHVGDFFDVFVTNPDGSSGNAIARGRVTDVKPNEAALKIEEYYKEVWIKEGYVARRPID